VYKALTYVNLPPDNRKAPGDTITKKELEDSGQDEVQIKQLLKSGAISENMDAEIDKAHQPIKVEGVPGHVNVIAEETGGGEDTNA
jgi:hypothetical protein